MRLVDYILYLMYIYNIYINVSIERTLELVQG
jgi:hypothetical protein